MPFTARLQRAVDEGLVAAALVDRRGHTFTHAGAIDPDAAMPLAALVMYRLKSDDLAARLFAGEILTLALDDRDVAVGVARRQLFVVALIRDAADALVRELVEDIASMLADDPPTTVPPDAGGSSSDPSSGELPLIELGITVLRRKA